MQRLLGFVKQTFERKGMALNMARGKTSIVAHFTVVLGLLRRGFVYRPFSMAVSGCAPVMMIQTQTFGSTTYLPTSTWVLS